MAGASNARLYFEDDHDQKRIGGWCAASRDPQWLKVDLGKVKQITGIATQGDRGGKEGGGWEGERERERERGREKERWREGRVEEKEGERREGRGIMIPLHFLLFPSFARHQY